MMLPFTPRPSQSKILSYRGGTLGISAVPGSGKTHILSALAAQIISSGLLGVNQEVLIVTLVNAAVDNFSARISGFIRNQGLIPHVGYRVRTLHGLAHDIVRENPALVGLDNRFTIVDEREADFIRKDAARAWLAAHPFDIDLLIDPGVEESKRDWVRRDKLPDLVNTLATAFIRSAKDHRQTPENLRQKLDAAPPLPLAEIGWDIYTSYQRALVYRGAVDFDDLIRLALDALSVSPELLARLQERFPFILEDEAQDSSALQEQILSMLSTGNWVRVGDPNQAIFETFTTAKPEYLLNFIAQADRHEDLPVSGRSQPAIINLANQLIDWVRTQHPRDDCRDALTVPYIRPTEKNDPQPNPPVNEAGLHLIGQKFSPDEEINAVVKSLLKWLPENQDKTVAVLVPTNNYGARLTERLKANKIDHVDYLSTTATTRAAAKVLEDVVGYLSDPSSASKLATAYEAWRRAWLEDQSSKQFHDQISGLMRKCSQVETYLAPGIESDWLVELADSVPAEVVTELESFREMVKRWQGASLLPIDQLILTLAQDLFAEPADLALAHKLALVLKKAMDDHDTWRLPELNNELHSIAKNERRFLGFSADDSGFEPDRYKGKVVVSTMHKAKGLEWDRVYLMSVSTYDFPSGMPNDMYKSELWYARGGLNMEAEALAQLKNLLSTSESEWQAEGEATQHSRIDYVRERLRLLYVGITRAKLELVITWNTGSKGNQTQAIPFAALQGSFENMSKNQG